MLVEVEYQSAVTSLPETFKVAFIDDTVGAYFSGTGVQGAHLAPSIGSRVKGTEL